MKKNKKPGVQCAFLRVALIALLSGIAYGQDNKNDRRVVSASELTDTNKIMAFNTDCWNRIAQGQLDETEPDVQTAYEQSKKLGFKKGMAYALTNKSTICQYRAQYPKALDYLIGSLTLYEELKSDRGIASCYNSMGLIYFYQKDFRQALKYYEKGLAVRTKLNDEGGIASALNNIGIVYENLGEKNVALDYYARALEKYRNTNNIRGVAKIHNNIGSLYTRSSDYKTALKNFLLAAEEFEKAGDVYSATTLYLNIGSTYHQLLDYAKALPYLDKALSSSQALGTLDLSRSIHEELSLIYAEMKKTEAAFKHYKAFIVLRDSLFNKENTKKLVESQLTFEFEKKEQAARLEQEKKDAVANEKLKRQQMMTWTFAGCGTLVLIFAGFVLRAYRHKKIANFKIMKQKEIIEEKQKEILDSIYYARRIQKSLLPTDKYIERVLRKMS